MEKFKAVILGTDKNAYSMAKSFHKEYGTKSLLLGKKHLHPTRFSRIIDVEIIENFTQPEVFLNKLLDVGQKLSLQYKKIFLISCSDGYTELLANYKDKLKKYFIVPYINADLQKQLEDKDAFYQMCEKYQLDYPKTVICDINNYQNINITFEFPVAVKPADSIRYLEINFIGKKKAYKIDNMVDLQNLLKTIYQTDYRGKMIIQDFIPGDDSAGFVLTTYSNAKGHVKMMCLGDIVLEHYAPNEIGNYAAIISTGDFEIYQKYQLFLEQIKYIGFAHFDFKYDVRDGKYKVFEINLRQGRSHYVTLAGHNMAKLLVDEYVEKLDRETVYNDKEVLWLDIPKAVLMKYANKKYIKRLKKLISKKQYGYTLFYKKDFLPQRVLYAWYLHNLNRKMFRLYFNKRGLM